MGAPGVVGLLGTPRALRRGPRKRQGHQPGHHLPAQAQRLLQRSPRDRRHVDDEVAFTQLGQERRTEEGNRGERSQHQQHDHAEYHAEAPSHGLQQRAVAGLGPADHGGILPGQLATCKQGKAQRRGHGECDEKRGQCGVAIGQPERREQASRHAWQGEYGYEHQRDGAGDGGAS